jgi:2-methylcitrate dehydratase PrpD
VAVTLGDGRTVQRTRYYASGTPQAPLTKEQIEEKFFTCAERAVHKTAATEIFAFLNRLNEERSFEALWVLVKRG